VHRFIVELHRERRVAEATCTRATALLGEDGLIDLMGVAGCYTLTSRRGPMRRATVASLRARSDAR
jgi:hypothetical protein